MAEPGIQCRSTESLVGLLIYSSGSVPASLLLSIQGQNSIGWNASQRGLHFALFTTVPSYHIFISLFLAPP